MVVLVGDTTAKLPLSTPGFQVYEFAPVAVKVELNPIHTAVGVAAGTTVGNGTTIKFTVRVTLQPKLLVPVTEYKVVAVGLTAVTLPPITPGFQTYVDAPFADKVALLPIQIEGLETVAFTVGLGCTTNATVRVLIQPKVLAPVAV